MPPVLGRGMVLAMRGDNPVAIDSHALGTLKFIRASIESAGSLVVPGMAGIAMGIVGLAAAAITAIPAFAPYWLVVWLAAAAVAFVIGGALMARQAALRGHALYRGPTKKFLLCLCPTLLAGAVLTFALWQAGETRLVPGTWLLLYGCAVLSASTMTSAAILPLVAMMGGLFVLYGLVALQLPPRGHILMLGLGFGALHLIFGILIGRVNHGD